MLPALQFSVITSGILIRPFLQVKFNIESLTFQPCRLPTAQCNHRLIPAAISSHNDICMHAHTGTHIHRQMHSCTHVYLYPCTHMHMHGNTHLTQVYTQSCTFTHTHKQIVEKAVTTHSSTLAWKIPGTVEPGRLQSMGSLRVGHDWVNSLLLFTFMHWRRKWKPIPVFLPRESQGRESLVGWRLWSRTESDTTEETQQQQLQHKQIETH